MRIPPNPELDFHVNMMLLEDPAYFWLYVFNLAALGIALALTMKQHLKKPTEAQ